MSSAAYRAAHRDELAARQRAYRKAHAEESRRRDRAYYRLHAEKIRRKVRAWALAHPEEMRAHRRASAERHRIERNERKRARRLAHAEYYAAWRSGPGRAIRREHQLVRNARKRASGPGFTAAEWRAVLRAAEGRCYYCQGTAKLSAEHRVPLCRGGPNTIDNIVAACGPCNVRKGRLTDEEFIRASRSPSPQRS